MMASIIIYVAVIVMCLKVLRSGTCREFFLPLRNEIIYQSIVISSHYLSINYNNYNEFSLTFILTVTVYNTVVSWCVGDLYSLACRCESSQYRSNRTVQAWAQLSPKAGVNLDPPPDPWVKRVVIWLVTTTCDKGQGQVVRKALSHWSCYECTK
jgi:hypothetical protein